MPEACVFLGYDLDDGSALIAPLGVGRAGHRPRPGRGRERRPPMRSRCEVAGALVVRRGRQRQRRARRAARSRCDEPGEELRAGAIDVEATGRIVVGGSRASAETLTRARAMGVAGIVLGGVLDKELRDFEATQARRREVGGVARRLRGAPARGLRQGRASMPSLFAWFRAHDGHLASLFGADGAPLRLRRRAAARAARPAARRRPGASRTAVRSPGGGGDARARPGPAARHPRRASSARSGSCASRTAAPPSCRSPTSRPPSARRGD